MLGSLYVMRINVHDRYDVTFRLHNSMDSPSPAKQLMGTEELSKFFREVGVGPLLAKQARRELASFNMCTIRNLCITYEDLERHELSR